MTSSSRSPSARSATWSRLAYYGVSSSMQTVGEFVNYHDSRHPLLSALLGPCRRRCVERILGPRMPRIAAPQLLANVVVGVPPKAREVARLLDGPLSR